MKEQEIQAVKQRFGIIGNTQTLNNAIYRAMQVANTDLSVLILGESGSGKESFSKIIHNLSKRHEKTFIAINCGAVPQGTIYSELFGHEKGAFTGASSIEARKGYFEVADGGTIFLDEIGEMPLEVQAMLLRVLENGEFIRMGASKPLKTNVRVVAATNVDLLKAVRERKFREDLYYRLSTVPISVPPLRERGNDIVLLFRKFTTDFADKYKSEPLKLDESAKQMLVNFRFQGNIRQLKNIAEQMSLLEIDRNISAEILQKYLPLEQRTNGLTIFQTKGLSTEDTYKTIMSDREILYNVLFDMRKEVSELKKLVLQLLQSGNTNVNESELLKKYHKIFETNELDMELIDSQSNANDQFMISNLNNHQHSYQKSDNQILTLKPTEENPNIMSVVSVHDVLHEETKATLSLEQNEKEMIVKALAFHKNRRKNAADELGISERTLYRKIKQYDLDK